MGVSGPPQDDKFLKTGIGAFLDVIIVHVMSKPEFGKVAGGGELPTRGSKLSSKGASRFLKIRPITNVLKYPKTQILDD